MSNSWLRKHALLEFRLPSSKKMKYSHYDMAKPNKQHQYDMLYVSHNSFQGNTCK